MGVAGWLAANCFAGFAETTKEHFGKVDGRAKIACAGGHRPSAEAVWEIDDAEFDSITDVNVRRMLKILAEVLRSGLVEEPGTAVHRCSMFSVREHPEGSISSASQRAAIGLVRVAAIEMEERDIRANVVTL